MNATFRLSDYQIRKGKEDVIERHLHGILSADPGNAENQEKSQKALDELLKEIRVRFGTIIKTDNVSFLLGAGASLAVGGVSLANIPKPLEKALLDKASREQKGTAFRAGLHCSTRSPQSFRTVTSRLTPVPNFSSRPRKRTCSRLYGTLKPTLVTCIHGMLECLMRLKR